MERGTYRLFLVGILRRDSCLFIPELYQLIYSYLSDSIGSRRAAFHAGNSPKTMPMPTLATKPAIGAQSGTYDGIISFTSRVRSQPIANPTIPPKPVSVAASIK